MTSRRPAPAFYRSELVRWAFMLTGSFVSFCLSPWGPTMWRNTPSLRFMHSIFPWPLMSALFAVYVLLLASGQLIAIIVGDILGLWLYLMGLAALAVTIRFDRPLNPFATAAMVLAVVLHFAAARLAFFQRNTADEGAT